MEKPEKCLCGLMTAVWFFGIIFGNSIKQLRYLPERKKGRRLNSACFMLNPEIKNILGDLGAGIVLVLAARCAAKCLTDTKLYG